MSRLLSNGCTTTTFPSSFLSGRARSACPPHHVHFRRTRSNTSRCADLARDAGKFAWLRRVLAGPDRDRRLRITEGWGGRVMKMHRVMERQRNPLPLTTASRSPVGLPTGRCLPPGTFLSHRIFCQPGAADDSHSGACSPCLWEVYYSSVVRRSPLRRAWCVA